MAHGYSNLEVAPPHSDLEVAYDHTSPVPVVHSHTEKIPNVGNAVSSEPFHYDPSDYARSPDTYPEAQPHASAEKRRICGLPLRTFLILLLVLLVVVAGAVGGAVAGVRAATQNNNFAAESSNIPVGDANTTQTPTWTAGSLPTPSASTTSNITTTRLPKPTATETVLERDCPSSNGSVYEARQSPLYQFRKLCNNKYVGFGVVVINTNEHHSLDACIERCAKWNVDNEDKIRAGDEHMCNSVCWRNSWDQDLPGQCFGFPLRNETGGEGGGEGTWRVGKGSTSDTRCDSAAWMNPYTV